MRKLYIHAVNIQQGGGKILLEEIMDAEKFSSDCVLLLNERIGTNKEIKRDHITKRFKSNVLGRIYSEYWLYKNTNKSDLVIYLGNLPPLFKLSAKVSLLIQNRLLIERIDTSKYDFRAKFKIMILRAWLKLGSSKVDNFIVQTPSMKRSLQNFLGKTFLKDKEVKTYIFPFANNKIKQLMTTKELNKNNLSFIYPASGELHKNHKTLIEAFCYLAELSIFPTLYLTIDDESFEGLMEWINFKKNTSAIKVVNLGVIEYQELMSLYKKIDCLIYPSTHESFGLPLYEAFQMGIPILASELDYVRDIVDPNQSFNPSSFVSIALSIMRFLGEDIPKIKPKSAEDFINSLKQI